MYDTEWKVLMAVVAKKGILGQPGFCHVKQDVLRYKWLIGGVTPNSAPEAIDQRVLVGREKVFPIVGPLLVNVTCPILQRDGRRKQYYLAKIGECGRQLRSCALRQMLSDLEAHNEIKAAPQEKRAAKVRR